MKLIKSIMCKLGKHKYYLIKRINSNTRKVGCKHCSKTWAMHDPTRSLLEWDCEFEELYKDGGLLSDI